MSSNLEQIKQAIKAIESDDFTIKGDISLTLLSLAAMQNVKDQRTLLIDLNMIDTFMEYRGKVSLAEKKAVTEEEANSTQPEYLLSKRAVLTLCQAMLDAELVALVKTDHH